VLGMYM